MRSMRERAEAAGAAFQVESAAGQGTLVRVGVPLAQ
jgi:signal transduction histidine kinase